jgi:hypothetical protein
VTQDSKAVIPPKRYYYKFKIFSYQSSDDLEEKTNDWVNDMVDKGWELHWYSIYSDTQNQNWNSILIMKLEIIKNDDED